MLSGDLATVLLLNLAFAPSDWWLPGLGPILPPAGPLWLTPLTYQFLHADLLHLVVNSGFLLAFGAAVERRIGAARFVAFTLLAGAVAAFGVLPSYALAPAQSLVLGASGAISGLFGAMVRFAFRRRRAGGLPPELLAALAFVAANLLVGLTGLLGPGVIRAVAWEAHLAGFAAGWLLFPLFDRRRQG